MVGALERCDAGAAGRQKGGLERCFDGVGAAQAQDDPRVGPGHERGQRLQEFHLHGGRMEVAHAVNETRGLVGDAADDRRVPVTGQSNAERCREVQVAVAVRIGYGGAFRLGPKRWGGIEARDPPRFDAGETAGEADALVAGRRRAARRAQAPRGLKGLGRSIP